ncbi:GFA family protein [Paracoccaceae bacterium GXU_MW_L88]
MLTGSCHCGAVRWQFDGVPDRATACNCTACRRYGVLWAYGHVGEGVQTFGETAVYERDEGREKPPGGLGFHFCPTCGCVAFWRGREPLEDGRRRIAVNLRLCDQPEAIAAIPLRHLDGLESWTDREDCATRTVAEIWF